VWDVAAKTLTRDVELEGTAATVTHRQGEQSAVVATADGLVTVQFAAPGEPPVLTATSGGDNRYHREAYVADRMLHLWDGRTVSSATLDSSGMPGPLRELTPAEAATGVAAVGDEIFFITPGGEIAGYSADGRKIAQYLVNESPDQRVLSIRSVAGALWVSLEVNCLSGGCEFRTLVLDPRNGIARAAVLPGGAVAVSVDGSKAWAVFDVPAEVRELDVANPFQPTITAATPSTGSPVAIARDAGRSATYVLGDQLYVYGGGLMLLAALLEPYEVESSGRVSYLDQRVHVLGDGAVITGRSFSPEVFTINSATAWFPGETPGSSAAAVRSSVLENERLYLLSDYSLEIWSAAGTDPVRRRPVR
jgi:hypothetical protein